MSALTATSNLCPFQAVLPAELASHHGGPTKSELITPRRRVRITPQTGRCRRRQPAIQFLMADSGLIDPLKKTKNKQVGHTGGLRCCPPKTGGSGAQGEPSRDRRWGCLPAAKPARFDGRARALAGQQNKKRLDTPGVSKRAPRVEFLNPGPTACKAVDLTTDLCAQTQYGVWARRRDMKGPARSGVQLAVLARRRAPRPREPAARAQATWGMPGGTAGRRLRAVAELKYAGSTAKRWKPTRPADIAPTFLRLQGVPASSPRCGERGV